jgi:hypothetical protein
MFRCVHHVKNFPIRPFFRFDLPLRPFVTALIWSLRADRASGSLQKPRIPHVCASLGVNCLPMLGMFKELGWHPDRTPGCQTESTGV